MGRRHTLQDSVELSDARLDAEINGLVAKVDHKAADDGGVDLVGET